MEPHSPSTHTEEDDVQPTREERNRRTQPVTRQSSPEESKMDRNPASPRRFEAENQTQRFRALQQTGNYPPDRPWVLFAALDQPLFFATVEEAMEAAETRFAQEPGWSLSHSIFVDDVRRDDV